MPACLKRKMRRTKVLRVLRARAADGCEIILSPVIGEDGRLHRFVVLNRRDPVPVHTADQDVYLRTD